MHIYQKTAPGIWSVGYFSSSGEWIKESDFNTAAEAAQHAQWLNDMQDYDDKPIQE